MASRRKDDTPDRQSIDEIMAAVNKDLGEGSLMRGSDVVQEVQRTTSGILALDLALGGGLPLNQWTEIVGKESDGKTAVAFKVIAANMALDPNYEALWVAAEAFVPSYAKSIGVDLDRLFVLETNVMEKVYEAVIKAIDNRAVDAVVIDSLPALVPGDEDEKQMEEYTVGLGARLTNKFFRKSGKAQRRDIRVGNEDRAILGIMINQWRDQIGVMYGDPRTTPGGKGKNYHMFVRLETSRDDWITGRSDKDKVGQVIKMRTFKNKTYKAQQVAQVDFYFDNYGAFKAGEFDVAKDVMFTALGMGVIEKRGGYYYFGNESWRGRDAVFEQLRQEVDLLEEVRVRVMAEFGRTAGAVTVTEEEEEPEAAVVPIKRVVKRRA